MGPSLIRMDGISSLSIGVVFHQLGAPRREIFSSVESFFRRSSAEHVSALCLYQSAFKLTFSPEQICDLVRPGRFREVDLDVGFQRALQLPGDGRYFTMNMRNSLSSTHLLLRAFSSNPKTMVRRRRRSLISAAASGFV